MRPGAMLSLGLLSLVLGGAFLFGAAEESSTGAAVIGLVFLAGGQLLVLIAAIALGVTTALRSLGIDGRTFGGPASPPTPSAPPTAASPASSGAAPLQDRVLAALDASTARGPTALSRALGAPAGSVQVALDELVRAGRVAVDGDTYRLHPPS